MPMYLNCIISSCLMLRCRFLGYFLSDHFDHIKQIAGSESIGIGGDYDGVERLVKLCMHVTSAP